MSVILFVDLLGVKRKWQAGGVPEATKAFTQFSQLVMTAIRAEKPGAILQGGIETDSAMFVFDTALTALKTAQRLFLGAFLDNKDTEGPRLWLRGSLVRHNKNDFLRKETRLDQQFRNVRVYNYSPAALDAISVEKAGFKGMRLLVRPDVIDQTTKETIKAEYRQHSFVPLRRLRHISYPQVVEGELMDFLWMACQDDQAWQELSLHMTARLRHAAKDPEEFSQAASTQVIFHEYGAMRQSVISRTKRKQDRKDSRQSNQ